MHSNELWTDYQAEIKRLRGACFGNAKSQAYSPTAQAPINEPYLKTMNGTLYKPAMNREHSRL